MSLITKPYSFYDGKCLQCCKPSTTYYVHKKCLRKYLIRLQKSLDKLSLSDLRGGIE